ncbi:MAG TPA: polysaccharide deacetylase family protein [Gemmatimonadaceae bacterium]
MRGILTYHSIDASGSPISLTMESFRSHIRFLVARSVKVVSLSELMPGDNAEDALALTFDDGFANFATTALPLLREHALPATVFIVSDRVGMTNEWDGTAARGIPSLELMTWAQINVAAAAGVEIGAHTRHHPDLTKVPDGELEDEIAGCADRIRAETGVRPGSFAYPYGAVNDRVARAARARFERSCTTDFRPLEADDDRALWPRLDGWYFREPGQLEQWGTPSFRRRVWLRAQGRRVRRLITAGP